MISGISSMAARHVLAELAGKAARIESVAGVEATRRVEQGEAFDFVVLAADAVERLLSAGRLSAGSRVDIARSAFAMAVAQGSPRIDIGSEAAVRKAVQEARSIGYSTGPSGAHLLALFERWGIAAAIAPRLVLAKPGVSVGVLLAEGKAELGFQQLSELVHEPGIEVLGALPPQIGALTTFSGAVCGASPKAAEAAAFLTFLAAPENDAVKRRHGMEPA